MDGQQPTSQGPDEPSWQFQPGQTVSPGAQPPSAAPSPQVVTPETQQLPMPEAASQTAAPAPELSATPVTNAPAAAEPATASAAGIEPETATTYWQGDPTDSISWTASEFIAHHKSLGWYVLLNLGVVALAAIVWFITKDVFASTVLVFAGIVLSLYGARKPRQLQYQVDDHGLTIQERHYGYQGFRSFSVTMDGPFATIGLMPLKRFSPLLTLYCDPQDEDNIIAILSRHLPHEDRKPDAIDSLMRRIRL
jgi:hypothetical protein